MATFEVLYGALVSFCCFPRIKGSEVATFAGFRIVLTRVKPILSGFEFPNHFACRDSMIRPSTKGLVVGTNRFTQASLEQGRLDASSSSKAGLTTRGARELLMGGILRKGLLHILRLKIASP